MEAAYELNSIVTFKLIVYTFGALVHLFLMVLILGNRRLRRLDWLLFGLIAALFLWNVRQFACIECRPLLRQLVPPCFLESLASYL